MNGADYKVLNLVWFSKGSSIMLILQTHRFWLRAYQTHRFWTRSRKETHDLEKQQLIPPIFTTPVDYISVVQTAQPYAQKSTLNLLYLTCHQV